MYKQPEIIVLTETWRTQEDHTTNMWEGYSEHHTVRNVGRSGGVSVLCMSSLRVKLIPELTVSNDTIESCVVEVRTGSEILVVFAIYRPHSDTIQSFNEVVCSMLQDNVLKGKQVIFVGDVNIDLLKCNSNYIAEFMDAMQAVTFTPVITKATRFPPGASAGTPSLLDQIWINRLGVFTGGIICIDTTDHCPTFLNIPVLSELNDKIELSFQIHGEDNIVDFKNRVQIIIANLNYEQHVDTIAAQLVGDLNKAYTSFFPLRVKYVSPKRIHKQWITPAILNSIKTKSRYFKLHKLGLIDAQLNRKFRNCLN